METLTYVVAVIGGAALYAIGYKAVESIFDYVKENGFSLPSKNRLNLTGTWHAAWQTTAEGKPNINTEVLHIKQKGTRITIENTEKSPENKLGGYLWRSDAKIYDKKHILGNYMPKEANVTSKGTMFFSINRLGEFMVGKWAGCNYDYDLTWGFGVIAKDRAFAIKKLKQLIKQDAGIKE